MDQEFFQIIADAKRGNIDAFTQLMKRCKTQVFQQAFAMLNDREEAKDVTQEAFIRTYQSLKKLESEYAFSSWLTRIVSNLCYDRLQKRKKENVVVTSDRIEETTTLSDTTDSMQMRITIQEAMQKLSFEHREVIILREIKGFTYDEISEILKIPVGTVKSRIYSARMALRDELSM
ncbi:RNA polymerase sigma factor [Brevibacillus ginsengisoli]|uniref:RNA polymerase sigma factor n=1 Tax=Brevibacillus ginsengisoli TaxID=363854 RepID=UPI003CEDBB93